MEKSLTFIKEKIEETKAAILFPLSCSPLKMPNYVINTFHVDEEGNIWFFINRPGQLISQFEQEFPVELNYFKKGNNYSVKIFGKAKMYNDANELEHSIQLTPELFCSALTWQTLISVKILNAEFTYYSQKEYSFSISKIRAYIKSMVDWTKQKVLHPFPMSYHFSGKFIFNFLKK